MKFQLYEVVDINPKESIKKGELAKKIPMDTLEPFSRDIPGYEMAQYSGGAKFRNGDTIMARITPCLENGKRAKVGILDDDEIGFGSTEYIVFRAKTGLIDEDYLYYLVCSDKVRGPAIKSMVGSSGRQRVQTDIVKNLYVELPDIDIQKRIGRVLCAIDDKIAINKKINKNLANQMASYYMNAKKTNAWPKQSLDNCLCFYDYMRKPLSARQRDGMKRIYPYYGAASVVDYVEDFIFDGTYILISEDGANVVDEHGHPLIQYTYGKFWVNNHAHIVKGTNGYSEALIYALLKTLNIQSIVTGAAQPKVNQANLRSFVDSLPPRNEAERLSDYLNPLFKLIIENDKENSSLAELRNTLLPKLMSGEIDVSNLNL